MTSDTDHILDEISSQGKKITKTRKAVVRMLCSSHNLMTAPEIQENLKKAGITINKTSVYRELDSLKHMGVVQEVNIHPGVTHYESALHPHHHHLVCRGCGNAEDIETEEFERPMKEVEEKALKQGFVVNDHSFEFFGLCASCK